MAKGNYNSLALLTHSPNSGRYKQRDKMLVCRYKGEHPNLDSFPNFVAQGSLAARWTQFTNISLSKLGLSKLALGSLQDLEGTNR